MEKIFKIQFLYISFLTVFIYITASGQEIGIGVYSGLSLNHSQRSSFEIIELSDNYYKDFLYGIDLVYLNKKYGLEIGIYKTKYANIFNLRGNPIFVLSKKNYIYSINIYNLKFGVKNLFVNNKKYKFYFNYGIEIAFTDFNKFDPQFRTIDSITYLDNYAEINFKTYVKKFKQVSYGVYYGISYTYLINKNLSLFANIYARQGIFESFELYFDYKITNLKNKLYILV